MGDLLDLLCATVHAVIGRTLNDWPRGREATSSQCRDSPGGVFRLDLCGSRAPTHFGKQAGAGRNTGWRPLYGHPRHLVRDLLDDRNSGNRVNPIWPLRQRVM